jgi:menaquinone-dependent protoporphyrinogen oxidase
MRRVLVLYGTTDGHTHTIADAVGRALQLHGLGVDVVNAAVADATVEEYCGVVVAASVHAGKYQPAVVSFVKQHAAALNTRPTAFVSVSLGVLQKSDPAVVAEVEAIAQRFLRATGWRPESVKHLAGALLYTRYNVFKRWIMNRIVAKAGGDTDTSRDYDYTNWGELRAFADEFGRRLTAAAA